ncbi:MAG TPA: hypothetical protein VH500_13235 [Nitrososphaeraceae archaeon]
MINGGGVTYGRKMNEFCENGTFDFYFTNSWKLIPDGFFLLFVHYFIEQDIRPVKYLKSSPICQNLQGYTNNKLSGGSEAPEVIV